MRILSIRVLLAELGIVILVAADLLLEGPIEVSKTLSVLIEAVRTPIHGAQTQQRKRQRVSR